jgi:hypothetical protein
MVRRVRCCGDAREDSGYAYCEVFECSCCEHLEHQMYGINSFIPRDCGFIEGPTWAEEMIRKGRFSSRAATESETR